jgi:predicted anti-sigma-YlaC factor YlaD
MSAEACPTLELLFEGLAAQKPWAREHLQRCPGCAAVVEEHRQLEKDLLRLSDPLPPPDFVQKVMARVQQQPHPVSRELWSGAGILTAALAAVVLAVMLDGSPGGALGSMIASSALTLRSWLWGAGLGLEVLWSTAALPLTLGASASLMIVLLGLRRLIGAASDPQVTA